MILIIFSKLLKHYEHVHIEEKNLIDKMVFLRGFALSTEIVFSVFFTKIWLMCIIHECIPYTIH